MNDLPKSLQYRRVQPKGFASSFKRWEIYPQTSYNTYNKNELVRFMFQTDQFIDPYQSYLEIQVTMDPAKYNYNVDHDTANCLLLDGPSTSLINELVVYSNSKEIERIQEYDQLGILLDDIGSQPSKKASRCYAGTRYAQTYGNIDNSKHCGAQNVVGPKIAGTGTNRMISNSGQQSSSNTFHTFDQLASTTLNITSTVSTITSTNEDSMGVNDYSTFEPLLHFSQSIFPFLYTTSPYTFCKSLSTNPLTPGQGLNSFGTYKNVNNNPAFRRNWESACNTTMSDILSDGQFGISSMQGFECTQSSIFGNWVNFPNLPTNYARYSQNYVGGGTIPYNYASSFTKSDFICPFVDYQRIQNGKFKVSSGRNDNQIGLRVSDQYYALQNNTLVSTRTFYVPILSGVIGQLIPAEEWRLIPGKALGQLMFEWRLNPNAFYNSNIATSMTSFYNAVSNGLDSPSNPPIAQWGLNWSITKFSMHFDLWSFDEYVNQQINTALAGEGILMTSQSFTMGPQYNIASTSNITNNWQINNGVPSLKTLWFWFLSQDYQKYDYCRKNYRLSHNITSIQLKVGEDYVPTQPIVGKAGNIHAYDNDGGDYADCIQFMVELDRVVGNFFHNQKHTGITPSNFVLNERCYDPTNIYHCLRGQTGWNEQRCVGKALYTIDTQSDPFDRNVLSGIDTTRKRPIELILKSDASNPYTGQSLMVVMLHYDMLVLFKDGEVRTIGTG